MYTVMLAVKSEPIRQELKRLRIWGDSTGFQICKITDDFEKLIAGLREKKYHLVLLEATQDNHMLSLLETIKKEKLCKAVAIVSQTAEFKTVRKSFLLGADDYFVAPFEISQFIALFSKIENAEHGKIAEEICQKEELLNLFEHVDFSIKDWLDEMLYSTLSEYRDMGEAFSYIKRILDGVMLELFEKYGWLQLYFAKEDYLPQDSESAQSPVLSDGMPGRHRIQGIGAGFIPDTLDMEIYDEIIPVSDEDAFEACRELVRTEGVLCGVSSGAALYAAKEMAKRPENEGKTIVLLMPDSGELHGKRVQVGKSRQKCIWQT